MTRPSFAVLCAALCAVFVPRADAASFTYRGELYEYGTPAQGEYSLRLSLYGTANASVPVFGPLTIERIPVVDGVFDVPIEMSTVPESLMRGWLSVAVKPANASEPFQPLIERSEVELRGGICPAGWSLIGNAGTTTSNAVGTTDNRPLRVIVNNHTALRVLPRAVGFQPGPSLIGGHEGNFTAFSGATIGGGGSDSKTNVVTGTYGTIGGGLGNSAAGDAFVGGGEDNQATASHSTVGGGDLNHAGGNTSFVGGGQNNTAGGASSTVAGGNNNQATATQSAILGGLNNVAAGNQAAVLAGANNAAVSINAVVGNGAGNCAGGMNSWAGGTDAKIRRSTNSSAVGACAGVSTAGANGDENTFMWADNQGNFLSTGPNQFMVRASGGIWFGDTGTAPPIPFGRLIQTSSGAYLTTGGTWTNASSRALKQAFEAVDGGSILDALLTLPIGTWQYKASPAEGRHLGPTAEDFAERFGLGDSDASISTVDASGVALAAIQGLNAKLERENEALRNELAALRAQVEAVMAARSATGEGNVP